MMKDPTDGALWIDVCGRKYSGDERTSFSRDMLSVDEAIEYLKSLKEKYGK